MEKALGLDHMEFNDRFAIVTVTKGAWLQAIWNSHRRDVLEGITLNSPNP